MKTESGLLKARSHIVFITGIVSAFSLIMYMEGISIGSANHHPSAETDKILKSIENNMSMRSPTNIRADQLKWAEIAWKYFENNTNPETGLANSVNNFPASTLWDTASYLNGTISAYRLNIIDQDDFDARISNALKTLARIPLFEDSLPNKSYHTKTLQMIDYNGQPSETGIGWSAIDIARILVPFRVLSQNYPNHKTAIDAVLARWRFDLLIDDGVMMGSVLEEGISDIVQEGRIGYEEYGAKALILWGFDAFGAYRVDDFIEWKEVEQVQIPDDRRDFETYQAGVYITNEPFMLDGLEFGFDFRSKSMAWQLLQAQEQRYRRTGIPTAVSEGHVNGAPYFVYYNVLGNGEPWAAITHDGEPYPSKRFVSSKAAFSLSALFDTNYTDIILKEILSLNDPDKGWFAGKYENGQTNTAIDANTNGIILESMHYRTFGPLLQAQAPTS